MDIADRIDHLFEDEDIGSDPSGALELIAAQVADLEPRLLLAASRSGEPRFAHAIDGGRYRRSMLRALARGALGLDEALPASIPSPGALYPVYRDPERGGCLLLWCAREPTALSASGHDVLARTASIVRRMLALHADRDRLARRIHQLENERNVLRLSHDRTVTELLESREEAARLEQEYVEKLETEVELRIADLRAALKQAELANRTKSTFLATMSHEIRTPLTAILGYAELLRDTTLAPDEVEEYTGVIRSNGQSLLAILSGVLEYSQMESRSIIVQESSFSVLDVIDEVTASFRPEAEGKGLRIRVSSDVADPAMSSDCERTRQILSHLVQNAVKFTASGEIGISVSSRRIGDDADQILVAVRDTGIGMTPEEVERIFEAFTQMDGSTTRLYGGVGLGLPIARNLARLLGGDITVTSRPGSGSTFTVALLRTLSGGTTAGRDPVAPDSTDAGREG